MAAAGVSQANRELVVDESAATAGEDGRTAGKTCPLLLAAVGGEPSDETVVWQYAPADRRAVASGGIAEAVGAGKSIQSQKGTEGCLTKPDRKAAVSSCGTRVGADGTLSRALGPATEQIVRWNPRRGIESVSYTHLRAHETDSYLVCRLLLEKK